MIIESYLDRELADYLITTIQGMINQVIEWYGRAIYKDYTSLVYGYSIGDLALRKFILLEGKIIKLVIDN